MNTRIYSLALVSFALAFGGWACSGDDSHSNNADPDVSQADAVSDAADVGPDLGKDASTGADAGDVDAEPEEVVCGESDVLLTTTEQLEELEGCTTLLGGISVVPYDRDQLPKELSTLTSIEELFTIRAARNLKNMEGFERLERVGENFFVIATGIENFRGLSNLKEIGGFFILDSNENLKSFGGLENLETVGALSIKVLPALQNLDGLSGLKLVKGDLFIDRDPASLITEEDLRAFADGIDVQGEVNIETSTQ